MDKKSPRSAFESAPAAPGLLRRWIGARQQPTDAPDSADMDLGYESALPWFTAEEVESTDPAR
jgi:hypothetical protein